MASPPRFRNVKNTKSVFLALAFFAKNQHTRAVRIGDDIIYKQILLQDLYRLTDTHLRGYRRNRNNPQKFMEDLVQGYRNNDYEIFHLINAQITPEAQAAEPKQESEEKETKEKKKLPAAQETLPVTSFQTPSAIKLAASEASLIVKKGSSRYLTPQRAASVVTSIIGATLGFGTGGPLGAVVGAAGGAMFPTFIKNGGGETILKGGRGALDKGEGLLTNLSRLDNFTGKFTVFSKGGLILIIALILGLTFLTGGVGGPATKLEASPITADASSCQFYRGDRTPISENFQSSKLLGYFQEVSNITSVPAVVLAAVSRVETPSSTQWTDANLGAFCPESGDGALGIMQIVSHFSHRTDAICEECIAKGASYLNKSVNQLSREDYCNPRTSLFLGAGFILKKLQYLGHGDATKWDPLWTTNKEVINKVVGSFYGCLSYPSCSSGPYNYGDDVWNSIQSCKNTTPSAVTATCPVLGGRVSTPSYQADPQRGHCSGSYGYVCTCGTEGRRAKAIDVLTEGKDVLLPALEGQMVTWRLIVGPYPIDNAEGGGSGYTFETSLGSDKYYLDMLHLAPLNPSATGEYISGVPIAKSVAGYVHLTIGKNIQNPTSPGTTSTDCDSGWLPSDFLCR